jgi:thiosulfate reductase cytochrome b subunit
MQKLAVALIMAAGVTFLVATGLVVLGVERVVGIHMGPEGFSRASSNLALIAIALGVWFRPGDDD